jgi:hypothetical protein
MNDSESQHREEEPDLYGICLSFRRDIRIMLKRALELSSAVTHEQFLSELIGTCPRCGSSQTKDCEHVEGIKDFTVGLCTACGHLWCIECGKPLLKDAVCTHWEICRKCDLAEMSGFCSADLMKCAKLNGA